MKSGTKHRVLHCSEYDCPMVLVQLKESLELMESGQTIEVITDSSPKFQVVLCAWAAETKDLYSDYFEREGVTHHFIKKGHPGSRRQPEKHPQIITNDQLKEVLAGEQNVQLLDVRENIEFMLGHVPEAINMPLSDLTSRISALEKEVTCYVICRTGNRSDFACKYMTTLGFKKVYNVLPGMHEWDGEIVEEDFV